jgi:hypothetical protein
MATIVTQKQLGFLPWQNISGVTIQQLWDNVNAGVDQEVDRIRTVANHFPIRSVPNASSVPDDSVGAAEGATRTVVEVAEAFTLTQGRVDSEATRAEGATSARRKARDLLLEENGRILEILSSQHISLRQNKACRNWLRRPMRGILTMSGERQAIHRHLSGARLRARCQVWFPVRCPSHWGRRGVLAIRDDPG